MMTDTRGTGRALIIDDGQILAGAKAVLEANGWVVLDVVAHADAFEIARRLHPDVILINLDLGVSEAEALLERLKLEPMTCSIPILLTGTTNAHAYRISARAADWLGMPIEPYTLIAKLQRLLANRRQAGHYVLIVDDEPDLVEIMSLGLTRQGFVTASAANGVEALESARCAQPDAILLDLDMPRLNGWDVLEQLKQSPALATVPVVILTGAARTEADRRAGLSSGAEVYLTKPCSIEQVAQTLLAVLKRG